MCEGESIKKPNATPLSFDTANDAIDYANKLVEDANRWLAVNDIDFCKRYESLNLYIQVCFRSALDMSEYQLIFQAVPSWWESKGCDVFKRGKIYTPTARGHRNGTDDLVFVGITKLVQCPQKIVPSLVWLKRGHDIKNFLGDVFGLPLAVGVPRYLTLHVRLVRSERELGALTVFTSSNCHRETSLIESRTKTADSVKGDSWQTNGHWFGELDLVKLLGSTRIQLSDTSVWVAIEEDFDLPIEFCDAAFGVLDGIP